jgi:hypothetical protein
MDSATYSLEKTLGRRGRINGDCKLLRGGGFVEREFWKGRRNCGSREEICFKGVRTAI